MIRATVLGVLCSLCVVALLLSFCGYGVEAFARPKTTSVTGIRFDSAAHTPVFERLESRQLSRKEFSASFDLLAYSTDGYTDVFQTAPLNNGIRLELHDRVLALLAKARNPAHLAVYVLSTSYEAGRPHKIRVEFDADKNVHAWFDGQEVVSTQTPALAYEISDITVGTGLLPSRRFNGRIWNFAYAYTFFKPVDRRSQILRNPQFWYRVSLCVAIMLLLLALARDEHVTLPAFLLDVARTPD